MNVSVVDYVAKAVATCGVTKISGLTTQSQMIVRHLTMKHAVAMLMLIDVDSAWNTHGTNGASES